MFDTEMPLRGGVVYQFMVLVDPERGTYEAQIFDGDRTVSHAGMRFRNGSTGPHPVLHFGGMCAGGDLSSSVDAIEILPYERLFFESTGALEASYRVDNVSVVVPEPNAVILTGWVLAGIVVAGRRPGTCDCEGSFHARSRL